MLLVQLQNQLKKPQVHSIASLAKELNRDKTEITKALKILEMFGFLKNIEKQDLQSLKSPVCKSGSLPSKCSSCSVSFCIVRSMKNS